MINFLQTKSYQLKANQKGFTLIEMLVVIAIISVLAGVVLTGVTGFQANARDTRRIGDLKNIQNFLELYFVKCGHYPGTYSTSCDATDPTNWAALKTMFEAAPFSVSNLPNDPVGGRNYAYGSDADNLKYVLRAQLERDNRVLNEDQGDEDGTQYGVDCSDSPIKYYCMTP